MREISVYFDHFWSLCDGQHCSIGLLWGIWMSRVFPTLLCYRFDMRTTLEAYTSRKWWKFEQFRFILIIFKVYATGNTAQLGFCGGYRLESSASNTLSIFALPMRYSWISVRTQNETLRKVLWDSGFSLTSETFVFRNLFHFFFSSTFLSSPTWFLLWFFHGLTFFFPNSRILLRLVNFFY